MSLYLFDKSIDSMTLQPTVNQKDISEAFHLALAEATKRFFLVGLMGRLLDWMPLSKTFSRACRGVHEFLDDAVNTALQIQSTSEKQSSDTKTPFVFIHDIVKRTSDKLFLRNLVAVMYIGATDTSMNVTSQIIFSLSRNPRVLEKLRQEIFALDNQQQLDLATIQKLPYLRAVINESTGSSESPR